MLSFYLFYFFCWQCELWQELHHGHCIVPTCGVNSKPVANNSFWRSKTHGLWDNFPRITPDAGNYSPKASEGRLGGRALPVSNKTVWCKTMGPVKLGMPMVGGFSFLAHDWDDLNPGIYAKGHFYQKAALAGYISDMKQSQNPAYNRFPIYTCAFYFTGWF